MNIKAHGRSLTLVQGHSDSTFSNFLSLETARTIEAKFMCSLHGKGRQKSIQIVQAT